MLKKVLIYIFCFFILSSCNLYFFDERNNWESKQIELIEEEKNNNFFVILPYDSFVKNEIENYYMNLSQELWKIDNIILIWKDKNNITWLNIQVMPQNSKLCFNWNCINSKTIETINNKVNPINPVFDNNNNDYYYNTNEDSIWEHIIFINKYFPESDFFPVALKVKNINVKESWKEISQIISSKNFKWNNLFIASSNFSHYIEEDFSILHDKKTIASLNYWDLENSDVDCPNCLQSIYFLAQNDWKNCFIKDKRTSIESLNLEENFLSTNNISHIYGKFDTCEKSSWTPITWVVFWKYFWFEDLSKFYEKKDLEKNPTYYYHNILNWIDSITFTWEYEEDLKDLKIDEFVWSEKKIIQKNIRNINLAFYIINEDELYSYKKENIIQENIELEELESPKDPLTIKNEIIERIKEKRNQNNKTENNIDLEIKIDKKETPWYNTVKEISQEELEELKKETNYDFSLLELSNDMLQELEELKEQNQILILFINRKIDEINLSFYDLTDYADMIIGIWWETLEAERFNNTDIYHSIWNLNNYIIYEVN